MSEQRRTSLRCRMGFHNFIEVSYGYPAGNGTYYEIDCCRRCGHIRRTRDDLYAGIRPTTLPWHEHHMSLEPAIILLPLTDVLRVTTATFINVPATLDRAAVMRVAQAYHEGLLAGEIGYKRLDLSYC